jgi:hypothetical protein
MKDFIVQFIEDQKRLIELDPVSGYCDGTLMVLVIILSMLVMLRPYFL